MDFVAIDLEMTGLDIKNDKIIEVGMVLYEAGKAVKEYSKLVNPGMRISEKTTDITGINDEMVRNCPYIEEILEEIKEFIGDRIILGHSIMWDYKFLKKAMIIRKIPFEARGIDTLKIARKVLEADCSKSLASLCKRYGIEDTAHHRALNDAQAAGELYILLDREYGHIEPKTFEPVQLQSSFKKEQPINERQKKRLRDIIERYNIEFEFDIDRLTRSEADRHIDKLLASHKALNGTNNRPLG